MGSGAAFGDVLASRKLERMDSDTQVQEPIDVHDVIAMMVEQMAMISWQKMGLQPDPISQKIVKDLDQARVSIDVVTELCRHLVGKLDDEDQRRIQNLQRDLKINFVQQSGGGS